MKTETAVPVSELYTMDFELVSVFAQRQIWADGVLFKREHKRSTSALIYLNGCTGVYTDLVSGESFFAPQKSLVYLPYGGRYTVLNVESKLCDTDAYLVEFNMRSDKIFALSPKPFLIEPVNIHYIEKSMRETVDCYESMTRSPALLKAKIFDLLMHISHNEFNGRTQKYEAIMPALEYMNKYPYDTKPINNYAEMCGLSCGGFSRLFKEYIGKSPGEYIIENKMYNAKTLLEESNLSVKEISQILNFESTSYFCRLFKKRNGVTPSNFRLFVNQNTDI